MDTTEDLRQDEREFRRHIDITRQINSVLFPSVCGKCETKLGIGIGVCPLCGQKQEKGKNDGN